MWGGDELRHVRVLVAEVSDNGGQMDGTVKYRVRVTNDKSYKKWKWSSP